MTTETKRQREKETVSRMIALYCRKNHGGKTLCPNCAALDAYVQSRSDRCPFMETKTFCSNCRTHRTIFRHPVMAVRHVIDSRKEKKRLETR